MTWQGVSEAECYDNRSVIAQIVRIKDRLTAVEQNVDPTLRTDLEAAIAELTALENTVGNVQTAVETNTGNITTLQTDVGEIDTELAAKADSATVDAALALKANATDVDADLDLKADKTQLTDGSVTMIGTATIGSMTKPVYLNAGVPKATEPMLPTKTGMPGKDTPKNPLYIKENVMCVAQVTGGYSIGNISLAGNGDSDASHVWVGHSYSLPVSSTDLVFGWQDLAIIAAEYTSETRTRRMAVVEVVVDGKDKVVSPKLKFVRGFDDVVVAVKDTAFHICCKISTRTSEMLAGYHFAGPIVGNEVSSMDQVTTSTGMSWYENVSYQGDDIPNFANYSQWTWIHLTS